MFQPDIRFDISILPSNIMVLRDDDFIDFVKEEAGHAAAALLEIQGINCVKSLLMTDNVYAIMDVKSKSLDGLKNKYGYTQDDGTFVIQPGVKGNIEYLIDLLKKKCIEEVKLAKSSKHNQLSSSSTIPKSTLTLLKNKNKYIVDTLNNWCENNKSKLSVQQFSLVEGEHYFILLQNDSNGALKCDIRCCCQKWSSLPLRRGKFQLSNFYRHLQGLNNICPALKKMISNSQLALPSSTNNPPPLITSDNVPQQVVSSNQIPIIPPSDTIQSNSPLSTASSTSISTANDESLMQ
ncbi:unnamed protein product [Rotaria magnacalcarata]|uniref:Uncharacterized protein n=1 Tax=Rotaria magnacalcarata TaxID=392030 RepID=A0A816LPT2_9BILA|nr:unnamed protein product [Rotaria magnacalcarata]CAF4767550.1 unnamed protein product [Rotaria magnacalcarata]CAF5189174.1 unnamed protein product [Rotaria magnacalcarata]